MTLQRALTLLGVTVAMALSSCGGERGSADENPANDPQATARGGVARAAFVLCPALEGIADELASVVGFARDRDRGVERLGSECFIYGESGGGGFIGVQLAPTIIQSIAMQASGYDSESRLVPDLGSNAVFIGDRLQPHVIFELLGQIIDVGIESPMGTPDEATMIQAAKLVRDALRAANAS